MIGRIASFFVIGLAWLYAGARFVADLIGYATLPDDYKVAEGLLSKLIDAAMVPPWWAVLLAAVVSTMWLMHVSWPRDVKQRKLRLPWRTRKDKIRSLENTADNMAGRIRAFLDPNIASFYNDLEPTLLVKCMSAFTSFEKAGFPVPKEGDWSNGNGEFLAAAFGYFTIAATYLQDGHEMKAKQHLGEFTESLDRKPQ